MIIQAFECDESGRIHGGPVALVMGEQVEMFGEVWDVVRTCTVHRLVRHGAALHGNDLVVCMLARKEDDEERVPSLHALCVEALAGGRLGEMLRKLVGDDEAANIAIAVSDVVAELLSARAKYPPMPTPHHGFGVIEEERDELWDEIKAKNGDRDPVKLRHEAEQLSAMGIRFILDIVDGGRSQL